MNPVVLSRLWLYWYRINSAGITFLLTQEIVIFLGSLWNCGYTNSRVNLFQQLKWSYLSNRFFHFVFWLSSQEGKAELRDCTYCSVTCSRPFREGWGTVCNSQRKGLDPVRISTCPSPRSVGQRWGCDVAASLSWPPYCATSHHAVHCDHCSARFQMLREASL